MRTKEDMPMVRRTAFVFPGTGSYLPGIFAEFGDRAAVLQTLALVDSIVVEQGWDPVSPLLLHRDAPTIEQLLDADTDQTQLVIFATSVALAALLDADYEVRPDVVFGHSFGEIAALVVAGAVSVEDGARTVCRRIAAFREAAPPKGGMVAIGMGTQRTESLISALDDWDLAVAVENSPNQTVVSGPDASLNHLRTVADAIGVRATRLPARYAFHHPMQRKTSELFAESLRDIEITEPLVRVYSDSQGRYLNADDDARALVSTSLIHRVRFLSGIRALYDSGVHHFVECGARAVLTRLVPESVPAVDIIAPLQKHIEPDDLASLLTLMNEDAAATARTRSEPFGDKGFETTVGPHPKDVTHPDESAELPARETILAELRTMYSRALEYPENLFTDHAELEADLGVDSLQRMALLGQALSHYGLNVTATEIRAMEYPTLGAVAALIDELVSTRTTSTRNE
jgi:acyl transferase domain-containing protein